ncbi:MAG: hypothetical protein HY738_08780 [Bacteroidia bacterium]|nr:hypothetical protein [Bacteroidia bacterium]
MLFPYARALLLLLLISSPLILFGQVYNKWVDTILIYQKFGEKIKPDDFNKKMFNEILLFQINKQRIFRYNLEPLQPDTILENAADVQASYMAETDEETVTGSGQFKNTGKRLVYYGGSNKAFELVKKISVYRGKDLLTFKEAADEIVFKWFTNKQYLPALSDPKYIKAGLGAYMDKSGKKLFVSFVLGNFQSLNQGAKRMGELAVPFTTKSYGLQPFDEKICNRCEQFRNIEDLQKGLHVENGFIYFKYNNLQALKKLIKKPKDGLAVDIIQKSQYLCEGANIIDNNLNNKGILLKRIWTNQLYKKNQIIGKKSNEIVVCLGKMPEGIGNEYELNLIIIQDNHVCRNLQKTYIAKADVEYEDILELLADTITIAGNEYKPVAKDAVLKFKIPFEAGKSEYKKEDIKAFLQALNEPDFTINELTITAYSSVEGSDEVNRNLQAHRAESIVEAFKSMQKTKIKTKIIKSYNLDNFKNDIKSTEYASLAELPINELQDYIQKNNLKEKLEPMLEKHRYALIEMKATYDVEGYKEQPYVVKMFNKAVKNNDLPLALSIQKYILKKIIADEYDKEAFTNQEIPDITETNGLRINKLKLSGLLMNKLWMENYINLSDLEGEYCDIIHKLNRIVPENVYINFNRLYCDILHEKLDEIEKIDEIQQEIEILYESVLSKPTVDALNLKFQFKIIEVLDTLDTPHPKMIESLERVKKIIDIRESNWQNALKLSYLFIGQNDYEFAVKLLEPFIDDQVIFEELLFLYFSLCSYFPDRAQSQKFTNAMIRASQEYPHRFCELFDSNHFSVQIFENPKVKELYFRQCKD